MQGYYDQSSPQDRNGRATDNRHVGNNPPATRQGNGGNYAARNQNQKKAPVNLDYPRQAEVDFGITASQWNVLTSAIFPTAKSADSILMALNYCRARNLDPFKKPVHIVPMYVKGQGYIDTVWPSIAELRTTAHRTGLYAGCDETEFGPEITKEFLLTSDDGSVKKVKVTFPKWARVTVYRISSGGHVGKFVGPKVNWLETYATIGRSDFPNDMWIKRSEGQLDKCSEAAALRKVFPEELGNIYSAEEMYGQVMNSTPTRLLQAAAEDVAPPASPAGQKQLAAPQSVDAQHAANASETHQDERAAKLEKFVSTAVARLGQCAAFVGEGGINDIYARVAGAKIWIEELGDEHKSRIVAALAEAMARVVSQCQGLDGETGAAAAFDAAKTSNAWAEQFGDEQRRPVIDAFNRFIDMG